jgi:hypothetical protein
LTLASAGTRLVELDFSRFRLAGAVIVTTSDRRYDNRKDLPEDFTVTLYPLELTDGGPALVGRGADLTMGGIGVILTEEIDQALIGEVWSINLAVPDKNGRPVDLTLSGLITHGRPNPDGQFYGLKFLELHTAGRSKERAALRQFLLSDLRDLWQGNVAIHAPSM